jgi:hypothetical protein
MPMYVDDTGQYGIDEMFPTILDESFFSVSPVVIHVLI